MDKKDEQQNPEIQNGNSSEQSDIQNDAPSYYNGGSDDLNSGQTVFERKKRSKKFLIWLIPVIAGGAAAAVIGGGAYVHKDEFWNDTYLGNVYAGGKTVSTVNALLKNGDDIVLTTNSGTTENISLADIGYKVSYGTDIQNIKDSQNSLLWFMHLTGTNTYNVSVDVSYDSDKLDSVIKSLNCVSGSSITAPKNAYVSSKDNKITIIDAVEGNTIDTAKLKETIAAALDSGDRSINLEESGCYKKPSVYADNADLQAAYKKMQSLNSAVITLDLDGAKVDIGPDTYFDWLTTSGSDIKINEDKITKYMNNISAKYNTYGSERKFKTTGLGTITVGGSQSDIDGNDSYGFMLDINSTIESVKTAILSGKTQTVDATWRISANTRNGTNGDIGNTYVEIDVTRQHMWYYVDGKLYIDTDVRTGTESSTKNTPTPDGVYQILSKSTDKYFTDFTPVVHSDYWMPFDWRGDGIHDANWYSTFGGTLYQTSGSHGCINTPYSVVEKIYNKITVGTPVIVYRS